MNQSTDIQGAAYHDFVQSQHNKDLLRLITCGSVDDGKSTLLGRILYDANSLFDDELARVAKDSITGGTQGGALDLALLVDGLAAEREQGITIDVAYRYFSTDQRKFIIADTPGHEQYTRNMVTGASTAELAVILIDAQQGMKQQTRRHSIITSLLGVRSVVVAVNKMDLVDFSQPQFNQIEQEFRAFARDLGFTEIACIPVCATDGDNVTQSSTRMSWYRGPNLLQHLETVQVAVSTDPQPFRFPVQWVNRPDQKFRGYCGTVASGDIRPGDEVMVLPSGKTSHVAKIVTMDKELERAGRDQAVTLTLTSDIDVSRGDMICKSTKPALVSDQLQAHIVWMSEQPMFPGRNYLLRTGNHSVEVSITDLKYKININDLTHEAAHVLALNDVGICNLFLSRPIAFDPYAENRKTGSFILIDRQTNATIGAGMIDFSLYRSQNLVWQKFDVTRQSRAALKGQTPKILWFTGLSGSGKSSIANAVEAELAATGKHTYLLDGDNIRHGLNKDLGFTEADRVENIRRIAEVARLMADAGLIVLVSFISPFAREREMAREITKDWAFYEIFVDTPLAVCEARDVKGLYAKARSGEIKNFTGISSPYEAPVDPDVRVDGSTKTPEKLAKRVLKSIFTD